MSPSSAVSPLIAFETSGGDAFAWSAQVSGVARCSGVKIRVNGSDSAVPVQMSGATFSARVPLQAGRNELVATCTTDDGATEASAPIAWNGRLRAGPTASIGVTVRGTTVTLDGRDSKAAVPDGAIIERYTWHGDPRHPSSLTLASGKRLTGHAAGPRLELRAPRRDGEYYVSLTVTDAKGRSDTSTTYFRVTDGAPRAVDMMREHPSWIDSAVVYAPIPALWGDDGPKALEGRLGYLKKLGVDALWLWPPAEERASGEHYAITDYYALDPSWGPAAAFKKMVDRAHQLGLHVLIDIVPNHMSDQSPYFVDAQKNGKASHYYDFFDRDAQGKPTHYFDWDNLPNLNYDNEEVRAMITQAFLHWVRDYGIDGFRVDAAWGVKLRRPDFWPQLRTALKRANPDLLMLAEASAVDPYYFSHGFDVAYDWTSEPGQWAWTSVFDFPEESAALIAPAITNEPDGYAADAIVLRFINNNDTGARFVDQYGPELTRVAATLQFTVPGIPAMFAGDEIGASYEPYSNLTPIKWRDRFGLIPLYRRLIALKHDVPSLNSHRVDVLESSSHGAFGYIRPPKGDGPPVLVVLNFDRKTRVELNKTPALVAAVRGGAMRDLLTDRTLRLSVGKETVSLQMAGTSALVLVPEGS